MGTGTSSRPTSQRPGHTWALLQNWYFQQTFRTVLSKGSASFHFTNRTSIKRVMVTFLKCPLPNLFSTLFCAPQLSYRRQASALSLERGHLGGSLSRDLARWPRAHRSPQPAVLKSPFKSFFCICTHGHGSHTSSPFAPNTVLWPHGLICFLTL